MGLFDATFIGAVDCGIVSTTSLPISMDEGSTRRFSREVEFDACASSSMSIPREPSITDWLKRS